MRMRQAIAVIVMVLLGIASVSGMGVAEEEYGTLAQSGASGEGAARGSGERAASGNGAQSGGADAGDADPADLPVTRLVLYTNGVGYFEHAGTVTGTQALELSVGGEEMNDLLQSLVLEDYDGGTIRPVRYPSRDPLPRLLNSYSLDLSGDPTLPELLSQARGERVEIDGPETLSGVLVNVERVEAPDERPDHLVTLQTEDGLRRIALSRIERLSFSDRQLQAELAGALEALARYRGNDEKSVTLRFEGEGRRRVRVGYVREMPVWKTSYRLVANDDGTAQLQGWAILDNPTDMDLVDVQVSFIAGQPISFVTELYDPVYVDRPRIGVAVGPSIVPPAYDEEAEPAPASMADRGSAARSGSGGARSDDEGLLQRPFAREQSAPSLSGSGVSAMAEGAQSGVTFAYNVTEPVTVSRHQSAMVPIVQQEISADGVSVYDPGVRERHPLRGLRLRNETGLHLAAGTITVYDRNGFAGNARIDDLVAGGSRLLTYAVDLGMQVQESRQSEAEQITAVRVRNGAVETSHRQRYTTAYRISSPTDEPRFLIVEHEKRSGYEPISPTPAPAETPESYRYGVVIGGAAGDDDGIPVQLRCEANSFCELEVVTERTVSRSYSVSNIATDQIAYYLENVELSERDRALLGEVYDLKQRLAEVDRAIRETESRLESIHREQERIRANMGPLQRDSSLYRRYLGALESQEDEIESLRERIDERRAARQEIQQKLDSVMASTMSGGE